MSIEIDVQLDDRAIANLTRPGGLVDQAVAKAAGKVRDRAKQIITSEGRVDTGTLRQSIVSERVTTSDHEVVYQVGTSVKYAIFQHEGVEGPVLPRHARVLRFKPSGSSTFIFRASTSGFAGIHFLTRAVDELKASDFAA